MERLIFEGRFLVNVVGGLMRQDDLRVISSRINWEVMFRTADYHRIASIMYLAFLGNGDKIPEKWRGRFFERFQESLRFGESCINQQREIFTLMDMMKIPGTVVSSCELRGLYPTPEMASCNLLKILFDESSYVMAKGYLVDLGYETDRFYKGYGEHMKHPSGFDVEIYHKLPFRTKLYERNLRTLLEVSRPWGDFEYVRGLSTGAQLVYMLARASYAYAEERLLIRDVLELYLFHRTFREQLNMEAVVKQLSEFQVDGLAEKILKISYMWFGKKEEILEEGRPEEDMTVYDVLENRVLSRGLVNKEIDKQALGLENRIKREIEKEQRQERKEAFLKKWNEKMFRAKRALQWILPGYRYMCSLYPILEKVPVLLPFCWLWRGLHQLKRLIF